MGKAPQDNSVEQRRRLLKGALGASSILTLGYGGSAAAASVSCVAKVREMTSGGPPIAQLTMVKPSATQTGTNWGWANVKVWEYKSDRGSAFDAFEVDGNVYKTSAPSVAVIAIKEANQKKGYPKDAWVLAYYTDSGTLQGTYPTYQLSRDGATPASGSCLASVNPGGVNNFTFGG